jgi:hypothetical protein
VRYFSIFPAVDLLSSRRFLATIPRDSGRREGEISDRSADIIIALTSFRRGLEDTRHRRLFDLWQGKAHPPQLPGRQDFSPVELDFALPHLELLDRLPNGFRFRLVGSALCEIFGIDPTGLTLDEAPEAVVAALGRAECAKVAATGMPAASARSLLLPLAENGRDIDMIMACVTAGPRVVSG